MEDDCDSGACFTWPTADMAKYDPPGAVDLLQALEDSFAKAREAQREAGLRLDGPEVA